ncbi:MAG: hypothetical protein ACO1SV_18620 [Fimbriimonas sp.]
MPLAFAALCLISPGPLQDARITLKQTARVEAVLDTLSKQAGVRLTAKKEEADDILIVALSNVPLKEAMDRIAWATYGQWEKEEDGFRLARDIAAERRVERACVEKATALVEGAIKRYRQAVLQPETLAPDQRPLVPGPPGSQERIGPTPETRLLANLLEKVPAKELVRLDNGFYASDYAVFSSRPTPVERAFGPDVDRILDRYIAEKRAAGFDWGTRLPLRAMLKGRCGPLGGGASLTLYNAKGESMLGTLPRIVIPFEPTSEREDAVPKTILDTIPADMKVPLSELSQAFSRPKDIDPDQAFHASRAERARNAEFFYRIQHPERFEPMAAFATDLWTAVAAKSGRNLVANLPDTHFVPGWRGEPPLVRELLTWQTDSHFDVRSGWLVLRPMVVRPGDHHQINRTALGRYVRTRFRYRSPESLSASGDFITRAGVKHIHPWIGSYLYWASEGSLTSDGSGGWALERFFGSLPDATRQGWLAGNAIDISTLSMDSRKALVDWMTYATRRQRGGTTIPELFLEPTVRFPQGYVTHGWLRAEGQDQPGFATRIPTEEEGKFAERWDSLESLAWLLGAMTKNAEKVQIHPATLRSVRLFAEVEGDPSLATQTLERYTPEPSRYVPWQRSAPDVVESIKVAKTKSPRPRSFGD